MAEAAADQQGACGQEPVPKITPASMEKNQVQAWFGVVCKPSDSVTYELRDILASQAMAACNNGIPGAGRR